MVLVDVEQIENFALHHLLLLDVPQNALGVFDVENFGHLAEQFTQPKTLLLFPSLRQLSHAQHSQQFQVSQSVLHFEHRIALGTGRTPRDFIAVQRFVDEEVDLGELEGGRREEILASFLRNDAHLLSLLLVFGESQVEATLVLKKGEHFLLNIELIALVYLVDH